MNALSASTFGLGQAGYAKSLSPLAGGLADSFSRRYMDVVDVSNRAEPSAGTLEAKQQDFAHAIARESRRILPEKEQRARETAEQFVASSLVEPILKQMRGNGDVPPPLGPSQGEKQFRAMMDTQVARDIVKRSHWPVVDKVAKSLLDHTKVPTPAGASPDAGALPKAESPVNLPSRAQIAPDWALLLNLKGTN